MATSLAAVAARYLSHPVFAIPVNRCRLLAYSTVAQYLTQKICGSGYLLATGGADLTVRLWCALGQQETHALETTFSSTLAAESFRYLAFGESDDSLLDVSERTTGWWNLLEGNRFSTIDRMQGEEITSAAFSPKHQSLAIGLTSGKVKIRNVSSQNVSNQNVSNQDSIETPSLEAIASSLAFSPDGRWLAIGLDDRTVQLWDVKAEKMIQPPLNPIPVNESLMQLVVGQSLALVRYF